MSLSLCALLALVGVSIVLMLISIEANGGVLRGGSASSEDEADHRSIRLVNADRPNGGDVLRVFFETDSDTTEEFLLSLDRGMFASDAKVTFNGQEKSITARQTFIYVDQRGTSDQKEWAAATVDGESDDGNALLISGVFSSTNRLGGTFRIDPHGVSNNEKTSNGRHQVRRLSAVSESFGDVTIESPKRQRERKRRREQRKRQQQKQQHRNNNNSDPSIITSSADPGNVWSPGCFPGDQAPLTVYMSIATDAGFVWRVNQDNVYNSTVQGRVDAVLQEVERAMSVIRPLYLSQMNVQLQIRQIIVGGLAVTESNVLKRSRMVSGTCTSDPLRALGDFSDWSRTQNGAAHWHLLTDCFPSGVVGAGYIGGLCSSYGSHVAFSSWTKSLWLTMAHEIGHVFGAEHVFRGGSGGLMDYGSGRLNGGDIQFSPENRDDVCDEITSAVKTQCRHVEVTPADSLCGNGVLEPSEQCECITSGQKSCGKCQNCVLTSSQNRQCSTRAEGFVVRTLLTPPYVSTNDETVAFAHPDCCVNGLLSSRSCGVNGRDVCSATGICKRACSTFGLAPCGFDSSNACIQRCMMNGECMGSELATLGPPPIPAGAVPDGLSCKTTLGRSGTCKKGVCTSLTTSSPSVLSSGTNRPSPSPTTSKPSIAPSTAPPTNRICPSTTSFIECPKRTTISACTSSSSPTSCAWCASSKTCQASSLMCDVFRNQLKVQELFGHCNAFAKVIDIAI